MNHKTQAQAKAEEKVVCPRRYPSRCYLHLRLSSFLAFPSLS